MTVTLISDLSDIAHGIGPDVQKAIQDAADKIAEDARSRVPVETGRLRDSIKVIEYNEPGRFGYRIVADAEADPVRGRSDGTPYAHMVEFGSVHNQPARPFLVPALEEGSRDTIDAVNDVLGDL